MSNIIKISVGCGSVWVNASKILYMKEDDGETTIYLEGYSLAIFTKEKASEIYRKIKAEMNEK